MPSRSELQQRCRLLLLTQIASSTQREQTLHGSKQCRVLRKSSSRLLLCKGRLLSRCHLLLETRTNRVIYSAGADNAQTVVCSMANDDGVLCFRTRSFHVCSAGANYTVKVSSAPAETNEPRRLLSRRRSECRRFLVNRVVRFRRPFHAVCFAKNERSCFLLLLFFVPTFSSHCRAVSPPPLVSL